MRANRPPHPRYAKAAAAVCLAFVLSATAAQALSPPTALPASLRQTLQQAVDDPLLADGFVGAMVVPLAQRPAESVRLGLLQPVLYDTPQRPVLFSHNAQRAFAPASNQKLFTAAAALHWLGADFRFPTRVISPTSPVDGTVSALYLVGGGDPSLSHDQLTALAQAVRQAGVTHVAGSVFGDGSRYSGRFGYGWAVDDLPWYYGPEVSALTLGRNQVDVYVGPGAAPGEPARVWWEPANTYLRVRSTAVTGERGSDNSIDFDREVGSPEILVSGRIALGAEPAAQGMAVPAVEQYAASVFVAALRAAGVTVDDDTPLAGTAPGSAHELARHSGPPVSELLKRLLKNSDNLYAELLFREIGLAREGRGNWTAGAAAVKAFCTEHNIAADNLRIYDGSGLSRYTLITPESLAGVLRAMAFHEAKESFYAALPIAGVDGTLGSRMRDTAAARNVRAKTGSYSNHSSLSGYVTTRSGDLLAVSVVMNHFLCTATQARSVQNRMFVALAEWAR